MASQTQTWGKGRNRGRAAARHEKNAKLWPQRGWERARDNRKKPSTSPGIPKHFLAPRKALSPFTLWQKAVLPKGWSAGGPSAVSAEPWQRLNTDVIQIQGFTYRLFSDQVAFPLQNEHSYTSTNSSAVLFTLLEITSYSPARCCLASADAVRSNPHVPG